VLFKFREVFHAISCCGLPRSIRCIRKPVGSGNYVVSLNAGQCAVKKAGAYGCTVDANGDPTECGAMVVNDATGEVTVAVIN
jgi:hypothetical protein